ncbi:serine/threonine-protein kinase VRK1-like [Pollicipes pollicipes]|uniref:serine/threonine-protein kinase VRK1-like n=1 Tax=Pollicipes pollicipes TaxID=41117 RepID=UPI0018852547|nr:serine/threonine-protein kinase VRK1-like [Pollicipes pollicipes]
MIDAWRRQQGLKRLGMPRFVASGSVEYGGQRYRFMVIDRFGTDLQKLLNKNGARFPMATVLLIGVQVLDTLEYVHSREYIHADIKAQNLLLGYKKGTENQVFLVDFGLACRYALDGQHKPYRPDLRKAHNGTIEFTSRDAHIGAHSRRGDLEILGYNLLQWACGRLPWQDHLQHADAVARYKNRLMQDVPALMLACFPDGRPAGADAIQHFLESVAALEFETDPDYESLRGLLRAGLRTLGSPSRLRFSAAVQVRSRGCAGRSRWTRCHRLTVDDVTSHSVRNLAQRSAVTGGSEVAAPGDGGQHRGRRRPLLGPARAPRRA